MAVNKSLLNDIADEKEEGDRIIEQNLTPYEKRQRELVRNPADRSAYIWEVIFEAFELDPEQWVELTPVEAGEIPPDDRGIDWSAATSAIQAAADFQAWIETSAKETFVLAATIGQRINSKSATLTRDDARDTALEGPGRVLAERQAAAQREG